jgi:hypothetical protein
MFLVQHKLLDHSCSIVIFKLVNERQSQVLEVSIIPAVIFNVLHLRKEGNYNVESGQASDFINETEIRLGFGPSFIHFLILLFRSSMVVRLELRKIEE